MFFFLLLLLLYDYYYFIIIYGIFFFYRFNSIIGVLENFQEKDIFLETYQILLTRRYGICGLYFIIILIIICSFLDSTKVGSAKNNVKKAFIISLKEHFGKYFTLDLEGKKIFFLLYIY
jgi:hypothetical protein